MVQAADLEATEAAREEAMRAKTVAAQLKKNKSLRALPGTIAHGLLDHLPHQLQPAGLHHDGSSDSLPPSSPSIRRARAKVALSMNYELRRKHRPSCARTMAGYAPSPSASASSPSGSPSSGGGGSSSTDRGHGAKVHPAPPMEALAEEGEAPAEADGLQQQDGEGDAEERGGGGGGLGRVSAMLDP